MSSQILEALNQAKLINRNDLPVIVKTSKGIQYLGNAPTHSMASMIGVAFGISCEKVSRAKIDGYNGMFFILH